MQCEKFELRLQRLLDRRQRPEADSLLREHALQCPSCQALLDAYQQMAAGLIRLSVPALSTGFAERVVAQARPDANTLPDRNNARTAAWSWQWVAVAAALLLLLVPTIAIWSLANGGPSVVQPDPRALPTGDRMAVRPEAGPDDDVRWPLQTYSAIWFGDLSAAPLEQQVDAWAGELRPIAVSFTAALSALRRSLPVVRDAEPPRKPQARRALPKQLLGTA